MDPLLCTIDMLTLYDGHITLLLPLETRNGSVIWRNNQDSYVRVRQTNRKEIERGLIWSCYLPVRFSSVSFWKVATNFCTDGVIFNTVFNTIHHHSKVFWFTTFLNLRNDQSLHLICFGSHVSRSKLSTPTKTLWCQWKNTRCSLRFSLTFNSKIPRKSSGPEPNPRRVAVASETRFVSCCCCHK